MLRRLDRPALRLVFFVAICGLVFACGVRSSAVPQNLIANGDFETGDFSGWTKTNTGVGDFVINNGAFNPASPDSALPPFAGAFSAISNQTGPGVHTIYQDVEIPAGAATAVLAWQDRIRNHGERFADPDQEFRVEIRDTAGQVLTTVFSTNPGDFMLNEWIGRSADLKEFAGRTIRIAFVEQDNLGYLNVHLDNVTLEIENDLNEELIANGDFEAGTTEGWTETQESGGDFAINSGLLDPPGPDSPMPPFAGGFSAIYQPQGPGKAVLSQTVSIPAAAQTAILTWVDKIRNHYSYFKDPDQEFRVEIRDAQSQLLMTAFSTDPGNPLMSDWTQRSVDLSQFIGQTVQVAFVADVHLYYMNVHIDNVSLLAHSGATSIYSEKFDADPGWTKTGEWAFGQPQGTGGPIGFPDPTSGCTGDNVYGVNLNGNYGIDISGPFYLTSEPIDCSRYAGIKLKFKRWLNTDWGSYVSATLEASNDGVSWNPIYSNPSSLPVSDNEWQAVEYDIGSVADEQPAVYLRWGYQVLKERAYPYSGWNIDDVELTGALTKGEIQGVKWNDLDGDGIKDPQEPRMQGWTIYLDQNHNRTLDPDEVSQTTDELGRYSFKDLPAGSYAVAEVNREGWAQIFPEAGDPGVKGYTSATAFAEDIAVVSTETFDELLPKSPLGSPSVSFDSVIYTTTAPNSWWMVGRGPGVPGYVSPPYAIGSSRLDDNVLSFGADRCVTAIGFWLVQGNYIEAHQQVLVEEADGQTHVFDVTNPGYTSFHGFASALGIKSVTIRDYAGDQWLYDWFIDDVSRTAIRSAYGGHSVSLGRGQTARNIDFGNRARSQAPGVPDLASEWDTGSDDSDNVTNKDSSAPDKCLAFTVRDTVEGATVRLYSDGVLIGSAIAGPTDALIHTESGLDLADGPRLITATQTESDKATSLRSLPLQTTIDTIAPTISSVVINPNVVAVGDTLSVSVEAADDRGMSSVEVDGAALPHLDGNTWAGSVAASTTLGEKAVTVRATDVAGNLVVNDGEVYKTAMVVGASMKCLADPIGLIASGNFLFRLWGKVEVIDADSFRLYEDPGTSVTVIAPGYSGIQNGKCAAVRGILDVTSGQPVLRSRAEHVQSLE